MLDVTVASENKLNDLEQQLFPLFETIENINARLHLKLADYDHTKLYEERNQKQSQLDSILLEYHDELFNNFLSLLESPLINKESLTKLYTRTMQKKFEKDYSLLFKFRNYSLVTRIVTNDCDHTLRPNQNKLVMYNKNGPLTIDAKVCCNNKIITSPRFFVHSDYTMSYSIDYPYRQQKQFFAIKWKCGDLKNEKCESKIYLAILFDNPSALQLFLEEYSAQNPNNSLMDMIINLSLLGFAAANGAVEVMKLFIRMGVALEQKFMINNTNDHDILSECDPKSTLAKHDSTLEMTALALALSAAPAMPREKAKEMIEVLLNAKANYNQKVIKSWVSVHGYHGKERYEPRSTQISLFNFDQSGILQELVSQRQNHKGEISRNKYNKPEYEPKNTSLKSEVAMLREENQKLQVKTQQLEAEVQKLWQVIAGLQITQPPPVMAYSSPLSNTLTVTRTSATTATTNVSSGYSPAPY